MSSVYTALTIGPIYKTLSAARKTRELWGGSYLFSYIMRRIIEELKDNEKSCLPYHADILAKGRGKGTGLFPDRLIYEGDSKDAILTAVDDILKDIAKYTELSVGYLMKYIKIYCITFTLPCEIDSNNKNNTNDNIVLVANRLLDTIELKEKHFPGDISNIDWRRALDKINGKLFYREAFAGEEEQFKFPSIIEIATDDFSKKNGVEYNKIVNKYLNNKEIKEDKEERKSQEEFIKVLKDDSKLNERGVFYPVSFRTYHKYIVVVQADGDNIGKTIGKIGTNSAAVRNFSSALFEFAVKACETIKNYGGKAVYVGGDDLLFFAPVGVHNLNAEEPALKSVFDLINNLDVVFEESIIQHESLKHLYEEGGVLSDQKPSMSYGISITYSKFPLNEARDNAYGLLQDIKRIQPPEKKNRINFMLHKHSGHGFGFMVDKNLTNKLIPKSFDYFLAMVSAIPLQEDLLSSVIYKLVPLHVLLNNISADKVRLCDFFDQEFELENLRKKYSEGTISPSGKAKLVFLDTIIAYFHQLGVDFPHDNKPMPETETEKAESNIAKLYSTLRFMKHLTDDDYE